MNKELIKSELSGTKARYLIVRCLAAKAAASVIREHVDKVRAEVLSEGKYVNGFTGKVIESPADDWQMDGRLFPAYWREVGIRLVALGHKPSEMPEDYCPALVAEEYLRKCDLALAEFAAPLFGIEVDTLLGKLENYYKFLELVKGMVSCIPGFKEMAFDCLAATINEQVQSNQAAGIGSRKGARHDSQKPQPEGVAK